MPKDTNRSWLPAVAILIAAGLALTAVTPSPAAAHKPLASAPAGAKDLEVIDMSQETDEFGVQGVQCLQRIPRVNDYYDAACRNTSPPFTVSYYAYIRCTDGFTYTGFVRQAILGQYGPWSTAFCPAGETVVFRKVEAFTW